MIDSDCADYGSLEGSILVAAAVVEKSHEGLTLAEHAMNYQTDVAADYAGNAMVEMLAHSIDSMKVVIVTVFVDLAEIAVGAVATVIRIDYFDIDHYCFDFWMDAPVLRSH